MKTGKIKAVTKANKVRTKAGSRCECPDRGSVSDLMKRMWYSKAEYSGLNHEPNQCYCTNELALYQRGDKKLWLCSCCYRIGDERIRGVSNDNNNS